MKQELSLSKVEKKAFICIFAVSVLALLSLIQANVLYNDDILRVLSGDRFWNSDGRPLSSLTSIILQLGKPLTDISPLPQIIAIAFYSISSIYLGKAFKVRNLIFMSLGGIIFVLNPFNLQNFSYIFDSFTMGLAVFLSSTAFFLTSIVIDNKFSKVQNIIGFFLIVFLLFLSLCLYQAATSIYLSSLALYSLLQLRNTTIIKSVKGFIFSLVILITSLIAYIPIKNFYIRGSDGYIRLSSQLPSFEEQPRIFIRNLLDSVIYINESLGNSHLSFSILILGIIIIFGLSLIILKDFRHKKIESIKFNKLIVLIPLIFFYCFILISSFYGVGLILANPSWKPRLFMGFSTAIGVSSFFLARLFDLSKLLKYFLISFLVLLCLSFANVSLTFGNTLYSQNTQEEIIATILLSDLEQEISKLSNPLENPRIAIAGQLQPSLLTTQAFIKYPILKNITTSHFRQGWWHGNQRLKSLEFKFDFRFVNINKIIADEESFISRSQPILSRRIYDIYFENNDTFLILFKE